MSSDHFQGRSKMESNNRSYSSKSSHPNWNDINDGSNKIAYYRDNTNAHNILNNSSQFSNENKITLLDPYKFIPTLIYLDDIINYIVIQTKKPFSEASYINALQEMFQSIGNQDIYAIYYRDESSTHGKALKIFFSISAIAPIEKYVNNHLYGSLPGYNVKFQRDEHQDRIPSVNNIFVGEENFVCLSNCNSSHEYYQFLNKVYTRYITQLPNTNDINYPICFKTAINHSDKINVRDEKNEIEDSMIKRINDFKLTVSKSQDTNNTWNKKDDDEPEFWKRVERNYDFGQNDKSKKGTSIGPNFGGINNELRVDLDEDVAREFNLDRTESSNGHNFSLYLDGSSFDELFNTKIDFELIPGSAVPEVYSFEDASKEITESRKRNEISKFCGKIPSDFKSKIKHIKITGLEFNQFSNETVYAVFKEDSTRTTVNVTLCVKNSFIRTMESLYRVDILNSIKKVPQSLLEDNNDIFMFKLPNKDSAVYMNDVIRFRKSIVSAPSSMLSYLQTFVKAKEALANNVFVALDVEVYERSQSKVTEIGITFLDVPNKRMKACHYKVEENCHLRNGRFVPDEMDNFYHGISIKKPLLWIIEKLKRINDAGCILICHSLPSEVQYLKDMGIKWANDKFDTNDLYKVQRFLDKTPNMSSAEMRLFTAYILSKKEIKLGTMCENLGINGEGWHNAGNDAYYTMQAFARMMKIEVNEK